MSDPFVNQSPLHRRRRGASWVWGLLLALIAVAIAGWYWNDVYRARDTTANAPASGAVNNPAGRGAGAGP
jgi:multidrug resistance efflux pump